MNDQETILIVQKFNTRGLALGKIKYRKFMYIKLSIYLNSKLTY